MPDFSFPDISSARSARSSGRWISVKGDSNYVGLSQAFCAALDASHQDGLILAFDEESRPWVGVSEQGHGASIYNPEDGSASVQSVPLSIQLRRFAKQDKRRRLYLNGDTAKVERDGETITLHRLTPEAEASDTVSRAPKPTRTHA